MRDPEFARTGRTTRQLQALPDGSIFIVTHSAQRDYCRHLLIDAGRRHDCLRIVTLEEMRHGAVLQGLPRTTILDVDHFCWESGMLFGEMRAHLSQWQHRYAVPPPSP